MAGGISIEIASGEIISPDRDKATCTILRYDSSGKQIVIAVFQNLEDGRHAKLLPHDGHRLLTSECFHRVQGLYPEFKIKDLRYPKPRKRRDKNNSKDRDSRNNRGGGVPSNSLHGKTNNHRS